MKITALFSLAALILFSAFTGVNPVDGVKEVVVSQSELYWKGYKVTGSHEGYVGIKSGSIELKDGKLVGGSFVVDMTSITCTDLSGKYGDNFVGHLKSDDFFSTDKYATAEMVITEVKEVAANKYDIKADFTVKGKKVNVMFTANTKMVEGDWTATAEFQLDRTQFDVRYGSPSFFSDLGDKAISNEFDIKVSLVAK